MRIGGFLEKFGERISALGYLLRNPGYAEVRRSGGARDLYRLLNKPWLQGHSIIGTILDVGANEGQFIKAARVLFPKASILAFEPNPRLMQSLQNLLPLGTGAVCQIACGREAGTLPLHLMKFSPSSSLLQPTSIRIPDFPAAETEETIEVKIDRLDSVVKDHPLARKPYLLKIDVQGFELEVLQGAVDILPNVSAIVCEVNAVSFYEGQAGFEEIYAFVRQHNFKLVDIGEPIRNRQTGAVLYFDVAFLNTSDALSV